jgi:hypothetical protein
MKNFDSEDVSGYEVPCIVIEAPETWLQKLRTRIRILLRLLKHAEYYDV